MATLHTAFQYIGWALNGLIRIASVLSGAALLLMMLQIGLDVVARNVFGVSLFGTALIVAYYYMVMVAFLPLALAEWTDSHIKVDVLFERLPKQVQKYLEVALTAFSAAFCLFVAWYTWEEGITKMNIGTMVVERDMPVPTWPAYFAIPLGFFLFGAVLIQRMFSTVGDTAGNGIGPSSGGSSAS